MKITRQIPWTLFDFEELESTNTFLKQNEELDLDRAVVNTYRQTKGKGRMGRSWISQEGEDLSFSIQLDLSSIPSENWSFLSLLAGLALSDLLLAKQISHQIKWPNDLAAQGRKLCGILCEVCKKSDKYFVIIGIGINVNSNAKLYPTESPGAISLSEISQSKWPQEALLWNYLNAFELRFQEFLQGNIPELCEIIGSRLMGINQRISWQRTLGGESQWITIKGINAEGQLIASGEEGEFLIQSGELSWKDLC